MTIKLSITVDDQLKAQTLRNSPRGEYLLGKALYVAIMSPSHTEETGTLLEDEHDEMRLMMLSLYPAYAQIMEKTNGYPP